MLTFADLVLEAFFGEHFRLATKTAHTPNKCVIDEENVPGEAIQFLSSPARTGGIDDCTTACTKFNANPLRFKIPALVRAGIPLQESSLDFSHDGGSTLLVRYVKPTAIIDNEKQARVAARESVTSSGGIAAPSSGGGRAPECKQS